MLITYLKNTTINLRQLNQKVRNIMSDRQKATKEGLQAELQAKKDEQAVYDYRKIMKNFINPARVGIGMSKKKY